MARDQSRVKPWFLRLPGTRGLSLNISRRPLAHLTPLPTSGGGTPIVSGARGRPPDPEQPPRGALTQNKGYRDELNVLVAPQSQLLKLHLLFIRESRSGSG